MEDSIARELAQELINQTYLTNYNLDYFHGALKSLDVRESDRKFYKIISPIRSSFSEMGFDRKFSIEMILRNKNAPNFFDPNIAKTIAGKFFKNNRYFTRDIRQNKELVRLMKQSENPYSLLGRFEEIDFETEDGRGRVYNEPILIIPGVGEDSDFARAWETSHAREYKDKFFSPFSFS